jgi:hypothetical protein
MFIFMNKLSFLYVLPCLFLSILGCSLGDESSKVCHQNQCVSVEIVQNSEAMAKGLQNREYLKQDAGMLFIFPGSRKHAFWMKDTLIPLDMIWIDYARRVVHIEENVLPCKREPCASYMPTENALYVLEVNAHHAKKMGIRKGAHLDFKIKDQN